MNLANAFRMMGVIARGKDQSLSVTDHREWVDLQDMADAGLVEVSAGGTEAKPILYLERLTDQGRTFLRAFPDAAPGAAIPVVSVEPNHNSTVADRCGEVANKWRKKFVAMHLQEVQ